MVIVRICLSAHLFCHSPSSSFTHTPFLCELCSVFLKNLSKSFIYCLRANRHIVSKSFALIELKWPFNHKCLWICLNRPKLDVWPAPCQLSSMIVTMTHSSSLWTVPVLLYTALTLYISTNTQQHAHVELLGLEISRWCGACNQTMLSILHFSQLPASWLGNCFSLVSKPSHGFVWKVEAVMLN